MKNPLDNLFRKLYQSTTCILITIYYEYYLLLHSYQMLENPIKTGRRGVWGFPRFKLYLLQNLPSYDC